MKFANATTFYRKSGAAEGLQFRGLFLEMFFRQRLAHNVTRNEAQRKGSALPERRLEAVMSSSPSSRRNPNLTPRYRFCLSPSSRKPRFHAPCGIPSSPQIQRAILNQLILFEL